MKKSLSVAMGATFLTAMAASPIASADTNPFGMQNLSGGYMQVAEGKCGEGKCGEGKDKAKEGKCGDSKAKEGKCGDSKAKEGKCGDSKTTDSKAKKEAKCGEGKCGGSGM